MTIPVHVKDRQLHVGDQIVPMISGEIHYWRLNSANWQSCLERIRELGIKMVASYICWDFHELAPGQFDFTGETDPARDLVAFLDLLTEEGFWIILRPGPYIYSEWHNNGVPDHAVKHHRLHPDFQRKSADYLAAVADVIRPYLATNGGRVVMVQADNEIDPWPHWYSEQLGLGRQRGPFHDFLRERYSSVAALNAAWGSQYSDFDQARAVRHMQTAHPDRLRRYLDTARFSHWYVDHVAHCACDHLRRNAIDVPLIVNTYSGTGTQNWATLEQIADLSGPDIYPSQHFDHRANEHRNFLEACRYAHAVSRLPYIAEFEAGIWHDWLGDVKTLTANHYRLMCLSALLGGVVGWNWYMLVNRDNWYQSPINEWGRTRPDLFNAFAQIVRLYNQFDPTYQHKQTATAVTYSPLQRATVRPRQDLLQAFYAADIDYTFFDVENGTCDQPILFYAGAHWLDEVAQQRLVDYVEQGGHLVCIGDYPRYDGALRPLNLFNIAEPAGIVSSAPFTTRFDCGSFGYISSTWVYNYDDVMGDPITAKRLPSENYGSEELKNLADLPNGDEYTIGYSQQRGAGRLTIIGVEPSAELLHNLHNHFALPIHSRSHTPNVHTALFANGDTYHLVIVNKDHASKSATVELTLPDGDYRWCDLVSAETATLTATNRTTHITASLPGKDGTIIQLKHQHA